MFSAFHLPCNCGYHPQLKIIGVPNLEDLILWSSKMIQDHNKKLVRDVKTMYHKQAMNE